MISSQVPPLTFKPSTTRRAAPLIRRLIRFSMFAAAALAIAGWLYFLGWVSWKIVALLLN
jgi:hypothetical protein